MCILMFDNIFVRDVQLAHKFFCYTSVASFGSCSAGGDGSDFCGIVPPSLAIVPPSVASGVCHARFCSSSQFTFFLLKKPNFA